MSIDDDIAAAKAAKPGDLAAIEKLAGILDELAETQRVTRTLQEDASLVLGAHLSVHRKAERATLLPGWTFSTTKVTKKAYDAPMVRSAVGTALTREVTLGYDVDRASGEVLGKISTEETILRTADAIWPLVGAHTGGFSGWRSEACEKLGVSLYRYRLDEPEDDGPVKGRAVRLTSGHTDSPDEGEAP